MSYSDNKLPSYKKTVLHSNISLPWIDIMKFSCAITVSDNVINLLYHQCTVLCIKIPQFILTISCFAIKGLYCHHSALLCHHSDQTIVLNNVIIILIITASLGLHSVVWCHYFHIPCNNSAIFFDSSKQFFCEITVP